MNILEKESLDKINIQQMIGYINKHTRNLLISTISDINDQHTRTQVQQAVAIATRGLYNSKGITDFRVICDETNNPPDIVATGNIICDVWLELSKTTDVIHITVPLVKTSSNTLYMKTRDYEAYEYAMSILEKK